MGKVGERKMIFSSYHIMILLAVFVIASLTIWAWFSDIDDYKGRLRDMDRTLNDLVRRYPELMNREEAKNFACEFYYLVNRK